MEGISLLPSTRGNQGAQGSEQQEDHGEGHLSRGHPFVGKGGVLHDRPFIGPATDKVDLSTSGQLAALI